MSASTSTSLTLLEALVDPTDQWGWERFDRRYRPLIVGFATRLGLDRDRAEEIAQRSAVAFFDSYQRGQYDRSKGRLKNWLLGIARHEIHDHFEERSRRPVTPGQQSDVQDRLDLIDDPHRLSTIWDRQWEEHVLTICLQRAARRFSDRDLRVKMLTAEGMSVSQVAGRMSLTESNVATIKHRILAYMRDVRARIERMG